MQARLASAGLARAMFARGAPALHGAPPRLAAQLTQRRLRTYGDTAQAVQKKRQKIQKLRRRTVANHYNNLLVPWRCPREGCGGALKSLPLKKILQCTGHTITPLDGALNSIHKETIIVPVPHRDEVVRATRAFFDGGHWPKQTSVVVEAVAAALEEQPFDLNRPLRRDGEKHVLDPFCGSGRYLRALGERFRDDDDDGQPMGGSVYAFDEKPLRLAASGTFVERRTHLWGCDTSRLAVRYAGKRQSQEEVRLALALPTQLPFFDESLDLVVGVFAPDALAEYARVLRPGGALVLASAGPDHLDALLNEEKYATYLDDDEEYDQLDPEEDAYVEYDEWDEPVVKRPEEVVEPPDWTKTAVSVVRKATREAFRGAACDDLLVMAGYVRLVNSLRPEPPSVNMRPKPAPLKRHQWKKYDLKEANLEFLHGVIPPQNRQRPPNPQPVIDEIETTIDFVVSTYRKPLH